MGERAVTAKSDDGQIALKVHRSVEMGGKGNGIRIPEKVGDLAVSFWPFKKDKRKDSHCGRYADPFARDRTSHCREELVRRAPRVGKYFQCNAELYRHTTDCRLEAEWRPHKLT